jgi:hypothetical protein
MHRRNAQAHAVEAAPLERAQELAPERFGLDFADVEADHLTPAGLMHRIGDHGRLGDDVSAVAHLLLLGVQPQVRIGTLERTLAKRGDVLVEPPAQR